mmetsp:Transcript_23929/g.80372  ORF Transcript_23929/g.80372 Transcript_23929/m.80372 type:complete len:635 (+) Transcript_23929:954-2858(+)
MAALIVALPDEGRLHADPVLGGARHVGADGVDDLRHGLRRRGGGHLEHVLEDGRGGAVHVDGAQAPDNVVHEGVVLAVPGDALCVGERDLRDHERVHAIAPEARLVDADAVAHVVRAHHEHVQDAGDGLVREEAEDEGRGEEGGGEGQDPGLEVHTPVKKKDARCAHDHAPGHDEEGAHVLADLVEGVHRGADVALFLVGALEGRHVVRLGHLLHGEEVEDGLVHPSAKAARPAAHGAVTEVLEAPPGQVGAVHGGRGGQGTRRHVVRVPREVWGRAHPRGDVRHERAEAIDAILARLRDGAHKARGEGEGVAHDLEAVLEGGPVVVGAHGAVAAAGSLAARRVQVRGEELAIDFGGLGLVLRAVRVAPRAVRHAEAHAAGLGEEHTEHAQEEDGSLHALLEVRGLELGEHARCKEVKEAARDGDHRDPDVDAHKEVLRPEIVPGRLVGESPGERGHVVEDADEHLPGDGDGGPAHEGVDEHSDAHGKLLYDRGVVHHGEDEAHGHAGDDEGVQGARDPHAPLIREALGGEGHRVGHEEEEHLELGDKVRPHEADEAPEEAAERGALGGHLRKLRHGGRVAARGALARRAPGRRGPLVGHIVDLLVQRELAVVHGLGEAAAAGLANMGGAVVVA